MSKQLAIEVIVSCPGCKQIEFMMLYRGDISLPHNYHRNNGHIIHGGCGVPCRLSCLSLTKEQIDAINNRTLLESLDDYFTNFCKASHGSSRRKVKVY